MSSMRDGVHAFTTIGVHIFIPQMPYRTCSILLKSPLARITECIGSAVILIWLSQSSVFLEYLELAVKSSGPLDSFRLHKKLHRALTRRMPLLTHARQEV